MNQLFVILCLVFSSTYSLATSHKVKESKLAIFTVQSSLGMFVIDCGKYPEKLEGLFSNIDDCQNWGPAPYLGQKEFALDAWKNQLSYELVGARYSIKSLGSDGKLGGEGEAADIILED